MTKFKAWLNAARLRTLPLSLSGVIVGAALATYYSKGDVVIFMLALVTTMAFQITSNFVNDYGDGVRGTDNDDRIGPKRAIQSGILTPKELLNGIIISSLISLCLVISLVVVTFGREQLLLAIFFVLLGLLSIWAALKYTMGESAYGYKGLGDVFVFVFFGLLGVLGTFYLFTQKLTVLVVFPAIAIGLLCTAVLNLNNLRDYNSDKASKKNTLVVLIGFKNGKIYHFALLSLAFFSILIFIKDYSTTQSWLRYLPIVPFVYIFIHLYKVFKINTPSLFDPELKKVALSTFFLAILMFVSCYLIKI